jgi:glycosyltransferase involved in cell wall biosynthesis
MELLKANERCGLSVIISLYDYKYPQNLVAVLKALRSQTIEHEIVISEEGNDENSIFKNIASQFRAKYVLSEPEVVSGKAMHNIGRVRNMGALASSGRFLYFSDADILIYNRYYLERLYEASLLKDSVVWLKPSIYRLRGKHIKHFISDYLLDEVDFSSCPLKKQCFVDYDLIRKRILPSAIKEVTDMINNQLHVCKKTDFEKNINNRYFDYRTIKRFIWAPCVHYGGTLCSFSKFMECGGFGEVYYSWGLEDDDFHWKLFKNCQLVSINKITYTSIVHFEHRRDFNNSTYKKNAEIFDFRKKQSFSSMLREDNLNLSKNIERLKRT